MIRDPIDSWIEKTTHDSMHGAEEEDSGDDIRVIARRHQPINQGNIIVELAEKIRPALIRMFAGVRDESGIPIQPATIRGISLNLAQRLVKEYYH